MYPVIVTSSSFIVYSKSIASVSDILTGSNRSTFSFSAGVDIPTFLSSIDFVNSSSECDSYFLDSSPFANALSPEILFNISSTDSPVLLKSIVIPPPLLLSLVCAMILTGVLPMSNINAVNKDMTLLIEFFIFSSFFLISLFKAAFTLFT